MSEKLELTKKQLFHFIVSFMDYRKHNPLSEDSMTLSELIDKCMKDKMMFASWFDGTDVMN